ncbi:MAG TPA: LysM domain-containing protein, partial [Candidatus Tectomicrobia bacterium]|nr:LysM domain-containing protein [Candidatus Tectomicrobia bacterium]
RLVTEHVNQARGSIERGAHVEARRRLLSALALDPSSAAVVEMLRTDVKEVEFVLHTVRPGETLASLAQRYYGDRSRLEVIWETNQLPPGRGPAVGTVLKIPEIPGVPFNAPSRRRPAPPPEPEREVVAKAPPEPPMEAPPEVNPLLAEAREAAERREYAVALADLDRFLSQNPNHREAIELRKAVLYRQGQAQLEQKNYDESYRTLTMLARLQPDYEDVGKLLQQARRNAVDRHYQEGLRLFRAERIQEAIREWRTVLEFEPDHANAKRNIEQAERLQRGLERRRQR